MKKLVIHVDRGGYSGALEIQGFHTVRLAREIGDVLADALREYIIGDGEISYDIELVPAGGDAVRVLAQPWETS